MSDDGLLSISGGWATDGEGLLQFDGRQRSAPRIPHHKLTYCDTVCVCVSDLVVSLLITI